MVEKKFPEIIMINEKTGRMHQKAWALVAGYGMWVYGAVAMVGLLTARLTIVDAVVPVTFGYLIVMLAQTLIGKVRPKMPRSNSYRLWFNSGSCPSGHATLSTILTVTQARLIIWPDGWQLWATVLLGLVTVLIAVSRVKVGVHFVSDVLIGIGFGFILGIFWLGII